jgi:hypothetical protein
MTYQDSEAEIERYQALAADAYAASDRLNDPGAQLLMRQIALGYDRLAWLARERTEVRSKGRRKFDDGEQRS